MRPNCLIAMKVDIVAVLSSEVVTRAMSANRAEPIPVPTPENTVITTVLKMCP